MAYSGRTYVGTGPGPEWVTVYLPDYPKVMFLQVSVCPQGGGG